MRHATAAILMILALLGPAFGTEIPLDDLEGLYEMLEGLEPDFGAPGERTMNLTFPDNLTGIDEVTFVVSGEWHAGLITCEEVGGDQDYPFLPPLTLIITSDAFADDDFFIASSFPVPEGEFDDLMLDVTSCCPPGVLGLEELIGAEVEAKLVAWDMIVGPCWNSVDSYGTVTEARLVITGTVATDARSWTAIKGLYD